MGHKSIGTKTVSSHWSLIRPRHLSQYGGSVRGSSRLPSRRQGPVCPRHSSRRVLTGLILVTLKRRVYRLLLITCFMGSADWINPLRDAAISPDGPLTAGQTEWPGNETNIAVWMIKEIQWTGGMWVQQSAWNHFQIDWLLGEDRRGRDRLEKSQTPYPVWNRPQISVWWGWPNFKMLYIYTYIHVYIYNLQDNIYINY